MRILQLISSIGFFGAENSMWELSKALLGNSHILYIGVIVKSGYLPNELLILGKQQGIEVKVFVARAKFDLKTISQIRRYIRENKIDIVQSHNYKSNFYSLFSGINLNVKRVATCHNWLSHSLKMKFYELLDKFILNRFDKIVAVSAFLKDEIINSGISEEKVMVINNGVDIEKFQDVSYKPQLKVSLGLKENDRVIGTIGRLTLEKGHIYLLKSFTNVVLEFPNTKLLIVGDGPLKSSLQATTRKLQLEDKVVFSGIRKDIPDMLNIMDLFVLPSIKEGLPMALLEAMLAKKTIIATRVGAVPKVIEDGRSGILVEPRDIDGLSNQAIGLLKDELRASFLANNAFEKAKNEFSAQRMAEKYIQAYQAFYHKKILQIEIAGKGGICHYTYNLSQALSRFNKVVLVTSKDYELKNQEREFKAIGIFNRLKTNPLFVFKLIKIFREKEIDIIHFQLSQYPLFVLFLCYIARIFSNKQIVITAHNIVSHEEKRWEKNIFRLLYKSADSIIVHAQESKLKLHGKLGINCKKITVIPHGNYAFFNPSAEIPGLKPGNECCAASGGNPSVGNRIVRDIITKKRCTPDFNLGGSTETQLPSNNRLSKNTHNILFFGYIREYKGLMYLIRALKLIKEKIPDVKLNIVGRPIEKFDKYLQEINQLGLKQNIQLHLDYVPPGQIEQYFQEASVVALPYLDISQSGVVQLAYAFAKPVVTTNVGGLSEVVDDGKSGFLVPPKDIDALADRISLILNNPELQQQMGNYALHLAHTKFSWDTIGSKTTELYQTLSSSKELNKIILPVLMYHRICIDKINGRYAVSSQNFEAQMRYLYDNGFKTITPEDMQHIDEHFARPVMITFDDGYETDYAVAYPILRKYGLRGTCFITTDFVGREGYLNWQQIKELKNYGFSIQSHTHSHPLLNVLSEQEIREEIRLSKNIIEAKLGSEVFSLSLPGGRYNDKVIDVAVQEGFQYIFSSEPGSNIINNNHGSLFYRFPISERVTLKYFTKTMSRDKGLLIQLRLSYGIKNIAKSLIGNHRYHRVWNRLSNPGALK